MCISVYDTDFESSVGVFYIYPAPIASFINSVIESVSHGGELAAAKISDRLKMSSTAPPIQVQHNIFVTFV